MNEESYIIYHIYCTHWIISDLSSEFSRCTTHCFFLQKKRYLNFFVHVPAQNVSQGFVQTQIEIESLPSQMSQMCGDKSLSDVLVVDDGPSVPSSTMEFPDSQPDADDPFWLMMGGPPQDCGHWLFGKRKINMFNFHPICQQQMARSS